MNVLESLSRFCSAERTPVTTVTTWVRVFFLLSGFSLEVWWLARTPGVLPSALAST